LAWASQKELPKNLLKKYFEKETFKSSFQKNGKVRTYFLIKKNEREN